jgi:DNA modification methylase
MSKKDIKLENAHILFGDALARLKELPDNSVDSIVTDPPYGLSDNKHVAETIEKWITGDRSFIPDGKGFMGKAWDSFVPPPAIWDECLRVLKPGGHLLAFFGSRTQDVGALSIRLAGFEIRDSIAWVYGSGFPKSLDISKAIDKNNGVFVDTHKFTEWLRSTGITSKQINEATGTQMASHYLSNGSQPAVPNAEGWNKIVPLLNVDIPDWVNVLVDKVEAEREVIGKGASQPVAGWAPDATNKSERFTPDITAPATDAAKQYAGWGTALKPAVEPIVVARKPLSESTVANNVLKWGTGGLNIDASRVGTETITVNQVSLAGMQSGRGGSNQATGIKQEQLGVSTQSTGRFPANIILDEEAASMLDEQADASRFFYVAKASKKDRNEGMTDANNIHPTVKPTKLMEYLIKLVTPVGGTVLDPFTGSGSTGKAALLNGFKFVGCELTEEYLAIIEGRLKFAENKYAEEQAVIEKDKAETLFDDIEGTNLPVETRFGTVTNYTDGDKVYGSYDELPEDIKLFASDEGEN